MVEKPKCGLGLNSPGMPQLIIAENNKLKAEIQRLRTEVLSLRASFGEVNGAEPIGCPCPGACSSPTVNSQTESGNSALKSRSFSENKHENSLISDRMTCAEKAPDFSGLWGLVDEWKSMKPFLPVDPAQCLEQELTRLGLRGHD